VRAGSAAGRLTLTVLVSDLRGSTALAERLDAEAMREVVSRYFDETRLVLEAHGGRIEKVIGDAIVAVFGLPEPREDDALRAVEAAVAARETLAGLNDHLETAFGVRLVNRTGIATGEVSVGEADGGQRVLTGQAMAVAAAMERSAPPFGIHVAEATRVLVGDAAVLGGGEGVGGPELPAPVLAHVLLAVRPRPEGRPVAAEDLVVCEACGQENPSAFARCGGCGVSLERAAPVRETRRTLTIVFADPALLALDGGDLDSDAARGAMSAYFAAMRTVLERHGATVEKFIGDAVMAVFGLPRRREDDALRAVRAAEEMQRTLAAVNQELGAQFGIAVGQRIGVNTGPVVAGDASSRQRLVTGDTVNVAARLEQAAGPGEVLLGDLTLHLVRGAVEVEQLEPLSLKGKAEPVPAARLVAVAGTGEEGLRTDTPFVGRGPELRQLRLALDEARAAQACRLVTVIGESGIGKTRLAREFLAGAGAVALQGRCLSYGEGITFLPLVPALRAAAGVADDATAGEALDALRDLTRDEAVAERVAAVIGLSERPFQVAELFWAVGRVLEAAAAMRPVVLCIDDAHWAEETLLDLLERLGESVEAPVVVLVLAREELEERRPGLGTGERSRRLMLEALDEAETGRILAGLAGDGLPPELARRLTGAAAGNPLFLEQLLSMLVEGGVLERDEGRWRLRGALDEIAMPPTVEALLAERVDDLPADERAVLEPASVVGGEFSLGAVGALIDEERRPQVEPGAAGLLRRRLVLRAPGSHALFDHRFAHLLVRDVAYSGILKRERARMHERFADWVEALADDLDRGVEFEEVLGYHLEQAHRYLGELGRLGERGLALGRRAHERLSAAGNRALLRGDMPAAANLLRRSAAALPEGDRDRPLLLVHAGEAEMESGRFRGAEEAFEEAAEAAASAGAPAMAATALLERTRLGYLTGSAEGRAVMAEARRAIDSFKEPEDEEGLARAWRLMTYVELNRCRWGAAERAAGEMIAHARRAGNDLMVTRVLPALAAFILRGPTPAGEGIPRCEAILREIGGDRRAEALTLRALGHLLAMQGDFLGARERCALAREALEELGWRFDAALVSLDAAPIELLAGRPHEAERELRRDLETLNAMEERNYIATTAGLLAEALYRQERDDEAMVHADFARTVAAEEDLGAQVLWRAVRGKLLARAGEAFEGEVTCREAVRMTWLTDDPTAQGDAHSDLAEVLAMTGRPVDAAAELTTAADLFERKGNAVAAARARERIAALA
jgi:class 3 adenylate cyclase/tetratricopeptide (TPR) repeat protein